MKFRILDEAKLELEEAAFYLDMQEPGKRLGRDLFQAIDDMVKQITENPLRFPVVEGTERVGRARTRRFSYAVEYLIKSDEIIVITIKHTSRHPEVGRDRGR